MSKKTEANPIGLLVAIGFIVIFLGYMFHWYDAFIFTIGMIAIFGLLVLFLLFINSSSLFNKPMIQRYERLKSDETRHVSSEVRQAVWERDHGKCVICGSRRKLHFDHIIPFSKGGSNTEKNIRILCEKCNLRKSDKIE